MQDFRRLKIWERSHQLAIQIYKATGTFPKTELYGLTSQIRRSSTSISANIAEGCGRGGRIEFARYLQISLGSAYETEYHLLLARDLGFLCEPDYEQLTSEVINLKRMIAVLFKKLKTVDC